MSDLAAYENVNLDLLAFDKTARLPTTVAEIPANCRGVHESVLRSWRIVQNVKTLLAEGASPALVLWAIECMEDSGESRVWPSSEGETP